MADAREKIDFREAIGTSLLITCSLVFAIVSIYALDYFQILEMTILKDISPQFTLFSIISAFNLSLAITMFDQLYT